MLRDCFSNDYSAEQLVSEPGSASMTALSIGNKSSESQNDFASSDERFYDDFFSEKNVLQGAK